MRRLKPLAFLIIIFVITARAKQQTTIEEAMRKSNIQFDAIIYIKEINGKKRAIVYYEKDNNLGLGLLEKRKDGWNWEIGKTSQSNEEAELTWGYSNLNDNLPMFYGVINNKAVDRVVIETKDIRQDAEIIEAADRRLWLVLLDKAQNPPVKIYGYGP
jgi:hypothetical protein